MNPITHPPSPGPSRLVPATILSTLLLGIMSLSGLAQIEFPSISPQTSIPAAATPPATTATGPASSSGIQLPASAQSTPDPKRETQATELRSEKLDMWSTETETRAIATGSVILTATNLKITCDRLEVVATRIGDPDDTIGTFERFKYILATGRVRIQQDDREATCGRAEVFPREEKVVLSEAPVLVDHRSNIITAGERMTLLRGQKAVQVDMMRLIGPPIQDLGSEATKDAAKNAIPSSKK